MKRALRLMLLFPILIISCTPAEEPTNVGPAAASQTASNELLASTNLFVDRKISGDIDVQGHRGARGLKPENTLPAFETALDLGVDTLELDLHFTADQVVVIWHDDEIVKEKCRLLDESVTDAPDPDSIVKWGKALMVSQLTLAEFRSYSCDENPDPDKFPGQNTAPTALAGEDFHPISLTDIFQFVLDYSQSDLKSDEQRANAAQVQFNIETKRKPASPAAIGDGFDGEHPGPFELAIVNIVEEFGLEDRVVIQSFDHRSLWSIRSVNDSIRLAALTNGGSANINQFSAKGAVIWSPNYKDLTEPLVSKAHKFGLQVIPWTVNDAGSMRDLLQMGVDGIITDFPDIALALEP